MSDTVKIWLWKNGDHFFGYHHLHPCHENGDPKVLGEPIGYALIKSSLPRELWTNPEGLNYHAQSIQATHSFVDIKTDQAYQAAVACLQTNYRGPVHNAASLNYQPPQANSTKE